MAWDFSTEPEFQAHLDWMREFVREEIWPIETLDLDLEQIERAMAPLQEQVKERGLWAAHLTPSSAARASARSSSASCTRSSARSPYAPARVRQRRRRTPATPRSSRSRARPSRRSAGCIRCWPATCSSAFSMTEPETAGSDPTLLHDPRRARRRRVGHQRPQVVLLQRLDRRLPDRDGRHRPRGAAATSAPR